MFDRGDRWAPLFRQRYILLLPWFKPVTQGCTRVSPCRIDTHAFFSFSITTTKHVEERRKSKAQTSSLSLSLERETPANVYLGDSFRLLRSATLSNLLIGFFPFWRVDTRKHRCVSYCDLSLHMFSCIRQWQRSLSFRKETFFSFMSEDVSMPEAANDVTTESTPVVDPPPIPPPPPPPEPTAMFMEAYDCAKNNYNWLKVSSAILTHPQWLTEIPQG